MELIPRVKFLTRANPPHLLFIVQRPTFLANAGLARGQYFTNSAEWTWCRGTAKMVNWARVVLA